MLRPDGSIRQANQLTNRNYDSTQASPATAAQASAPGAPSHDIPDRLGGYKIVKELETRWYGSRLPRKATFARSQRRIENDPIALEHQPDFPSTVYSRSIRCSSTTLITTSFSSTIWVKIVAPTFSAWSLSAGHSIAVEIRKRDRSIRLVAVNYAIQAARGFSSRMRKA